MKLKKIAFLGILLPIPLVAVACNNASDATPPTTTTKPTIENNTPTTTPTTPPTTQPPTTTPMNPPSTTPPMTNTPTVQGLKDISDNRTFTSLAQGANNTLLAVDNKNQLVRYQNNKWTTITNNIHSSSPILESRGRISAVDVNGNYVVIQGNTVSTTNLKVSLQGGFVHLGIANIVVVQRANKYYLARVELGSVGTISSINTNIELLPDSKPVQIGLGRSENSDGPDIAVIAKPSSTSDYTHGVLGDKAEGKTIFVTERHNMNDIQAQINLTDSSVFEESRLFPIKINNKYYLATIHSGQNDKGAQVVILDQQGKELKIVGESPQLPKSRWISFNVINDTELIANHTPHIGGSTFKYDLSDLKNIKTTQLTNQISTHKINTFNLSILAASQKYLFAPSTQYNQIVAVNLQTNQVQTIPTNSTITDIKLTSNDSAYVLLANGKIVEATFK